MAKGVSFGRIYLLATNCLLKKRRQLGVFKASASQSYIRSDKSILMKG